MDAKTLEQWKAEYEAARARWVKSATYWAERRAEFHTAKRRDARKPANGGGK